MLGRTVAFEIDDFDVSAMTGWSVVVVGPAPRPADATDADVEAAVRAELAGGASPRDAAAAVSEILGVSRRRAYDAAHRARG